METLLFMIIVTLLLIIYGIVEFIAHKKYLYSIPIRIHVNGTRGKSSVSRLIGAGLRAGGIKTVTKVTGTYPRLILEDGSENHIIRKGQANIIEQLAIVKAAAERKAEALVIECMALQPAYQKISEEKMIRSTIGIITNVRADHLDVMGPTLNDVGEAMSSTIPENGKLFVSGNKIHRSIKNHAGEKNSEVNLVSPDIVSENDMSGFNYIEHRENVAIALKVCENFGIKKRVALEGMYMTVPDEGALIKYRIANGSNNIDFINAFAANDPDSSYIIWEMLKRKNLLLKPSYILLNTREDRLNRSRQLLKMIGEKIISSITALLLMGDSHEMVERAALNNGIPPRKIKTIRTGNVGEIYEEIISFCNFNGSILALGNMGGSGGELSDYFRDRSSKK